MYSIRQIERPGLCNNSLNHCYFRDYLHTDLQGGRMVGRCNHTVCVSYWRHIVRILGDFDKRSMDYLHADFNSHLIVGNHYFQGETGIKGSFLP